jgi:hypothetical protein
MHTQQWGAVFSVIRGPCRVCISELIPRLGAVGVQKSQENGTTVAYNREYENEN